MLKVKYNRPSTLEVNGIRLLPDVVTEIAANKADEFLANVGVQTRIATGQITIVENTKDVVEVAEPKPKRAAKPKADE